jgi:putative component of membrane protein insertase Oxa1/YidC/SpoIIIJ protein YidD
MKHLLLFSIKLYWLLVPKTKRRKCIFRTSCSKKVFEVTKEYGFLSGYRELKFRIENCNSEFDIYTNIETGKLEMILKSGVFVKEKEISTNLL